MLKYAEIYFSVQKNSGVLVAKKKHTESFWNIQLEELKKKKAFWNNKNNNKCVILVFIWYAQTKIFGIPRDVNHLSTLSSDEHFKH